MITTGLGVFNEQRQLMGGGATSNDSLSLFPFNGHFSGKPGLAGDIEAKDDGGGGDNWSYKSCKAPV